jgi:hypothetical protein
VQVDPALATSAATIAAAAVRDDPAAPPPAVFACDACGLLLLDPSVLPCGHVVCRPCVPGVAPAGEGEAGSEEGRGQRCPACGLSVDSASGVCTLLDKVLRSKLPSATAAREERAAPSAAAAEAREQPQPPQEPQLPPGDGSGAGASGRQPARAVAAEGRSRRGSAGGGGRRAPPPAVEALLASGRPLAELWPDLQRELMRVSDEQYIWHAVGCDDCGAYPIVGRRYKCRCGLGGLIGS